MQGDRIAASTVAQWALPTICPGEIWSPYVGRPSERGTQQGSFRLWCSSPQKQMAVSWSQNFFSTTPPHFFHPILSGLLAPCVSWSSSLSLDPRGLPELWNEVKLPHWQRSHWIALNRSQPSEKACFRRQNRIRCGVDQYCRVVWTWNALLFLWSDKAVLTAGGKELFRTLGKKQQRVFNGRETCIHPSERLWSNR